MKKLLILCLSLLPLGAFAAEPLMLLNPSRETFLNFPSAILPDKIITAFLPEPAVPLHRMYPVVYVLGAIPKDAPFAQAVLEKNKQKAILVGINLTQEELSDPAKVASFIYQDVMPYIESNYPTLSNPSYRAVVAKDPQGLRVAAALLARKQLISRAVLWHSGEQAVALSGSEPDARFLVVGARGEVLALQEMLEEAGRNYGSGFVTRVEEASQEATVWQSIDLDYLFAPAQALQIKSIKGKADPAVLSISQKESAFLTWQVKLSNQMTFDYIAPSLRITPPYLNWDAQSGQLTILSGAMPEKVKMSLFVDKSAWKGKIRLKK